MDNYAILINTTDSFEDCWQPFFELFSFYWPDYKGKIYLNTESKEFVYPGLNIISIKNGFNSGSKKTWSECLMAALDATDSEVVLYMQEDYFLQGEVRSDIVKQYADLISVNDIDCIHFTYQSTPGPFSPSKFEDLWVVDKFAPWRLSCQTALWKKSILKQYVRKHENPWQFEVYGSKRASFLGHNFLVVNRETYGFKENTIINYIFTGIVKGKWRKEVVDLFSKHNILVDYQKRGFFSYDENPTIPQLIKRKITSFPAALKSRIEIFNLRMVS